MGSEMCIRDSRKVFAAAYRLEPGDTLEALAELFRYRGAEELAQLNRVEMLDPFASVALPGWFFIHARLGDTLDSLAEAFDVERGWPRAPGRRHRPDPRVPLEHEIVAVPGPEFAAGREPA